jgi:Icc-related predicted phosphoesterase
MKIQIISDVHVEHWRHQGPEWFTATFLKLIKTDADVLVIAGDFARLDHIEGRWTERLLKQLSDMYSAIVYVPGNHEFYGTSIWEGIETLRNIQVNVPNLHVPRIDEPVEIDGQRFLGDTGWFPEDRHAPKGIYDFHLIHEFEDQVYREYRRTLRFLAKEVRPDDVVVTHHAPSKGSIAPTWRGSALNAWFCADRYEEEVIKPKQPRFWIHGHMHQPFSYMIGETQVVCNPFGYPREHGTRFNPSMVIDLSKRIGAMYLVNEK